MENYSIWLLEYGYCTTQPVSSLVFGKHNQGACTIPFTFLIIKGNGHLIAVDTGYYDEGYAHDLTVRFGVDKIIPIDDAMASIGISGKDVDTVILTHAHYDHAGGIKAFPNAQFYIQEKEFLDWMKVLAKPHEFDFLTIAIDPNDIKQMIDLMTQNRLTFVNGEVKDFLPGIDLVPVFDSHTYGLQLVTIKNTNLKNEIETWVFTTDVCYSFDNFGDRDFNGVYRPVGFGVGSLTEMVKALDTVMKLAENRKDRMIIPHEETMWKNFPTKVGENGMHVAEICLAEGEPSRI
ncbi:MAG: N-acyl homoserine lactonase family protein [Spirochaetaceae bacterium]|jgi:N-acyl homoserine lactone hydrolase|nr:N-acyl homoserine lactonase family protein [Spirochaetaceae bacterium]